MDDVLREAERLTHSDRNATYGPPSEDYARVAAIYNAITGSTLTSYDCALMMIAVKLARIGKHHHTEDTHKDSIVDLCGYAWVYAQCREADTIGEVL